MSQPADLTPPPVPLALVEWLERLFPDRFPADNMLAGGDLMPALNRQAGRVEVVRLLRQHAERQAGQATTGRQPTRTQSPF